MTRYVLRCRVCKTAIVLHVISRSAAWQDAIRNGWLRYGYWYCPACLKGRRTAGPGVPTTSNGHS